MKDTSKNKPWGGARPGSGRKLKSPSKKKMTYTMRLTEDERDLILHHRENTGTAAISPAQHPLGTG